MTTYLLSNGRTTTDLIDYIIDYIRVYLVLEFNDIPYSGFGNSMDLSVNVKQEVLFQVRKALSTVVGKLSALYPSVNLSLGSVEFNSANQLLASIDANDETINMRLK